MPRLVRRRRRFGGRRYSAPGERIPVVRDHLLYEARRVGEAIGMALWEIQRAAEAVARKLGDEEHASSGKP